MQVMSGVSTTNGLISRRGKAKLGAHRVLPHPGLCPRCPHLVQEVPEKVLWQTLLGACNTLSDLPPSSLGPGFAHGGCSDAQR